MLLYCKFNSVILLVLQFKRLSISSLEILKLVKFEIISSISVKFALEFCKNKVFNFGNLFIDVIFSKLLLY